MDEKNQYISGLTVGPTCYVDDRKRARRKHGFTLFNAALDRLINNPNEKTRKNKKSVKRRDDKVNGNKNNDGNNAEAWKKFVGSMRPLHMQASLSSSPSPHHSPYSEPGLSTSPLSATSWGTASKFASPDSLQDSASMGTMSPSVSPNNLQEELANTGTTSPSLSPSFSPNNLQERESTGTMSPNASSDNPQKVEDTMNQSASSDNLQKVEDTMNQSASSDNPQKVEDTMNQSALSNNLQEQSKITGAMSNSVSDDDLEEFTGPVSYSVSATDLKDLARASSRRKHRAPSGRRGKLGKKVSSRKSTRNLQDLGSGKMRRYIKSALNLHDLDLYEETDAEEDVDDKLVENFAADKMIDVKADQFIKQFYQQMKSQRKHKRRQQRSS